jgi:hypothetical protein
MIRNNPGVLWKAHRKVSEVGEGVAGFLGK